MDEDDAIRAALAGIAVELDEAELDERRPWWPKFVLAALGVLAIIAVVAGVVWRKQTAVREVAPVVVRPGAADNADTALPALRPVEEVTAPAVPSGAAVSPKTESAKP